MAQHLPDRHDDTADHGGKDNGDIRSTCQRLLQQNLSNPDADHVDQNRPDQRRLAPPVRNDQAGQRGSDMHGHRNTLADRGGIVRLRARRRQSLPNPVPVSPGTRSALDQRPRQFAVLRERGIQIDRGDPPLPYHLPVE